MPTSSFSFTNTADMTGVSITPVAIKPITNYALIQDEPTNCELVNKTAKIGWGEVLSFQAMSMPRTDSKQKMQNPPKNTSAIAYKIRLDEDLRTFDNNELPIQDDAIVMEISVRHNLSSYVTEEKVDEVWHRLLGGVYKEDGTTRFGDLMRSALKPDQN